MAETLKPRNLYHLLLQALLEAQKQLAEAADRAQRRSEELQQLQAALQEAKTDGDAAKSKLTAERENSATLDRARASAIQVRHV